MAFEEGKVTIALIISLILFVALFTVYAYQANRFVGVALAILVLLWTMMMVFEVVEYEHSPKRPHDEVNGVTVRAFLPHSDFAQIDALTKAETA